MLLVTAGVGLSVTSRSAAPAASTDPAAAASSTTICVAVVVDATSIGGTVSTGCAKVHRGATGVDVLQSAGHTLTFRDDGLLCTIDGQPSSGCADVDDSHFWAYYHRRPGSTTWSYSNEGPATYQPANDSTEGWVYRDGRTITPRNVPYAQICSEPEASATPTPTHSKRVSPTASGLPRHRPTHSARPLPRVSSPRPTGHPKATIVPEPRRHLTGTPTPYETFSGSPPQATPTISSSPAGSSGGGHGGVIGAIVAAVLVVGLGAAAVLSNRRRRR